MTNYTGNERFIWQTSVDIGAVMVGTFKVNIWFENISKSNLFLRIILINI